MEGCGKGQALHGWPRTANAAGRLSARRVKGATLEVYPKGSHGLATRNKDELNADLPAFIRG